MSYVEVLKYVKGGAKIKIGMIRLGFPTVSSYPQRGVMFENGGGTVIFEGRCRMGNNTNITIGEKGVAVLGDNLSATTSLRLCVFDRVEIGKDSRIGWDVTIMDTDFHKISKLKGGYSKGHAPIKIGAHNWIANSCKIMKRTQTPDYCIVQGGTILSGPVNAPEYSIVGPNTEVVVKTTGVWRDVENDKIEY